MAANSAGCWTGTTPPHRSGPTPPKRALELAHDPKFRRSRSDFYEWQHSVLSREHSPEDAVAAMVKLAQAFNDPVERSGRGHRWETVVLYCSLTAAALTTAAGLFPASFSAVDLGPLAGAHVVQVGGFGANAAIQIAQHIADRDTVAPAVGDHGDNIVPNWGTGYANSWQNGDYAISEVRSESSPVALAARCTVRGSGKRRLPIASGEVSGILPRKHSANQQG